MNPKLKRLDYYQRLTDLVLILISWAIAYIVKFIFEVGGESTSGLSNLYISYGFLLGLVSIIVFKNSNVYNSERFENISKEVSTQLKANLLSFLIFLVLAFFLSQFRLSRVVLISYFLISSFLLFMSKLYFRGIFNKYPMTIVLVGNGMAIKEYYEKVRNLSNFKIISWIDPPKDVELSCKVESNLDLNLLEEEKVGAVVIGYEFSQKQKMDTLLNQLEEYIIPTIILPDFQYSKLGHTFIDFKGQTLIYLNDPKTSETNLILKRCFDFLLVAIGFILISPLMFFIAFLVKITSKGPILYGQVRLGVDGEEFKMWKFRSMVQGVQNHGGWTVKDDPRVTKLGKFLRKTSLDELPQLWNVLRGEMSLVGPRPERPQYVNQFRKEIPSYMLRHKFKAGITGWAQINGWRGDTSIEKRIECDLWYIKNWSLGLDIYIIWMTFWKGLVNKNAY